MKIRSSKQIIKDTIDRLQLPDDITTIFYNYETGEEIGFSFEDEDDCFIPVEMFDDYNEWKKIDGAISMDGWEGGIVGHYGTHLIYDTDKAIEYAVKERGMEEKEESYSEVYDDWSYNALDSLPYIQSFSRPIVISFSANF